MEKNFYYGTSNKIKVGTELKPTFYSVKEFYARKNTKRIPVTDSIDAAVFYAKRSAEKDNGIPVVYLVEPNKQNLLQKTSTDYVTSDAKIIKQIDIEEYL